MSRHLDLMPAGVLRRQAIGDATWLWSRVLLAAGAICGAVAATEVWRAQEASQVRAALEAEYAPITQLRADIRTLRSQIAGLHDTEKLAIELAIKQPMTTLLGRVGQSAAYAGGELFIERLGFNSRPSTPGSPGSQSLRLQGAARDSEAISRFADRLREAGLFSEVQLRSTGSRTLASQPVTAFDLTCDF
ncbi:MAG: PilN domain-containing protein [Planctomycetota bacterium]